jgi:FkbM family methyltransferase
MIVWRNSLKSGDLFVDVGANIGSYAIWAADLGAQVIALEPAEDTFELLQRNVDLNRYSIHTIQAAAGPQHGIARFTAGRDDWNRFDPTGGAETEVVTLDSVIGTRSVTGMKVDVEGFEIDVLRGCEQALSEQRIGLIQLEWNSTSHSGLGADRKPVADLLDQHGYRLFRPDRQGVLKPLTDLGFGPDVFARPG